MSIFIIAFHGHPTESDFAELELEEQLDQRRSLWTSRGSPETVSRSLRHLLPTRRIRSATLLSALPSADRIGLALEWVGQLVVEAQLLELLGSDLRRWTRTTTVERQGIVVLRPLSDADRPKHIAEGPEEFQSALRSREPVVAWADVGQVRQDLGAWFGELADPATGGANAILSLCGALSDRSERLLLRNPAALGLEFEDREDALAAHLRAQTVRARAVGMSISDLRYESPGHHDLRLSSEAWNQELAMLRSGPAAGSYLVLLELEAPVDPEIVIGEGLVIEQTRLNGVQTLASTRARSIRVDVNEIVAVALPAWCLNRDLASPSGQPVRPTVLRFPVTGSQSEVWNAVADQLRRSDV